MKWAEGSNASKPGACSLLLRGHAQWYWAARLAPYPEAEQPRDHNQASLIIKLADAVRLYRLVFNNTCAL